MGVVLCCVVYDADETEEGSVDCYGCKHLHLHLHVDITSLKSLKCVSM